MESFWIQTAIGAIKAITFVYDVISFPIYLLLQRPWKRRTLAKRIKVRQFVVDVVITFFFYYIIFYC
jgi:long-chain acyl-CoA synthetase